MYFELLSSDSGGDGLQDGVEMLHNCHQLPLKSRGGEVEGGSEMMSSAPLMQVVTACTCTVSTLLDVYTCNILDHSY